MYNYCSLSFAIVIKGCLDFVMKQPLSTVFLVSIGRLLRLWYMYAGRCHPRALETVSCRASDDLSVRARRYCFSADKLASQ